MQRHKQLAKESPDESIQYRSRSTVSRPSSNVDKRLKTMTATMAEVPRAAGRALGAKSIKK